MSLLERISEKEESTIVQNEEVAEEVKKARYYDKLSLIGE